MTHSPRLILASASPRRKELLRQLGLRFEIVSPDVDEEMLHGESPEQMVRRLAVVKAEVVAKQHPEAWVLAADTTVVLPATSNNAEEILGKPSNAADAERMLGQLQGREHFVYSGFALCRFQLEPKVCRIVRTTVRIKSLSQAEIAAYVATNEPMDKAGGYAAQGIGAIFIEAVQGSYTNVVGLPLAEVHEELVRVGLWRPENLLDNSDR